MRAKGRGYKWAATLLVWTALLTAGESADHPGTEIYLWLYETNLAVADGIEQKLNRAIEEESVRDADDALHLLEGMARRESGARELAKLHGWKWVNKIERDGESLEVPHIEITAESKPYPDRRADVSLRVFYSETSPKGGIERSVTQANGVTRLSSGWPTLVFRWDQDQHTRLLLAKIHSPPTSREQERTGVITRTEFRIYQETVESLKRKYRERYAGYYPFRYTSKGELWNRFTARVLDAQVESYSEGYFLSRNPKRSKGDFILVNPPVTDDFSPAREFRALFPWRTRTRPIFSERYPDEAYSFPRIRGDWVIHEPKGRYTNPPFQRGRFPDPDEIVRHDANLPWSPLNTSGDFFTVGESSTRFSYQLQTTYPNEPKPVR